MVEVVLWLCERMSEMKRNRRFKENVVAQPNQFMFFFLFQITCNLLTSKSPNTNVIWRISV